MNTTAPATHYLGLSLGDDDLRDLPIAVRNAWLDEMSYLAEEAQCRAEWEAERRAERWYEDRGGYYAGSLEEAQDRYLDGLVGR